MAIWYIRRPSSILRKHFILKPSWHFIVFPESDGHTGSSEDDYSRIYGRLRGSPAHYGYYQRKELYASKWHWWPLSKLTRAEFPGLCEIKEWLKNDWTIDAFKSWAIWLCLHRNWIRIFDLLMEALPQRTILLLI